MQIDHESLLEFEDSLHSTSPKDTSVTLRNLEVKIEHSLVVPCSTDLAPNHDISAIVKQYDYKADEFTKCNTCNNSIESLDECCKQYIEDSENLSTLERNYWMSFLNNPTRTINTLPNYSQFLFLQQGVPFQLRSLVWRKLFLINYNNKIPDTSLLIYKNFQHSYNSETSDQISKDLNRTFPTIKFFQDEQNSKELEIILNVYANYDVELGYCQGLLFLVGSLYYQFKDPELTFHSLITCMESETELHDIFTPDLMSITLNNWYQEFEILFDKVDPELYQHLVTFVDMKTFLFQWWLSFMSSHTPEFSIINRIIDFCLIQGWKVGMFKISLGLLIANKPILMTLLEGEEEVVYQHMLYECKWGLVLKDLNSFFGELLLSFDGLLFLKNNKLENKPMKTHKRTQLSMIEKFKNLNISNYSLPNSNNSIFSRKQESNHELESIYSDVTVDSSNSENSKFVDYLRLPFSGGSNELLKQNRAMKELLSKCMDLIDDDSLKSEIAATIED